MSNRRQKGISTLSVVAGRSAPVESPTNHFASMMNQLQAIDNQMVPLEDGSIQIASFRITPIGLLGGEGATLADWEKLGKTLFRLHDSLAIIIGDWLVQGERVHGKTFEQVAFDFDRKKKTLYNWKWVMSSVDISLRGELLTYKHYRIVAAMDYEKQAHWLGLAIKNKWGAGKMQDEINEADPPELPDMPRLRYSKAVEDAREMFNKRSERINRALDGKDNLDEETVWACVQDIEKFVKAIRENFGWDEE